VARPPAAPPTSKGLIALVLKYLFNNRRELIVSDARRSIRNIEKRERTKAHINW
jgi:hypothetical protein